MGGSSGGDLYYTTLHKHNLGIRHLNELLHGSFPMQTLIAPCMAEGKPCDLYYVQRAAIR